MNSQEIHPALDQAIRKYTQAGYRVVSQTATSAQMVRPKKFSCLWASLWTLLVGIGLIFYLFYYMAKKDEVIYLQVVDDRVKVTKS